MLPSFLANMEQDPAGPPAPPDTNAPPAPDFTVGQAPAQQTPSNPVGDIASSMDNAAQPQRDKGGFFREPGETKGHALLRILTAGIQGGLNGEAANAQTYAATGRNAGFGGGFQGAQVLPMERQMMGLQVQQLAQSLPFLRAMYGANLAKTQSEVGKNVADASKAQAEVEGMPIKQALEKAQAEAANYKEDPNLGLIDIRTKQAVNQSGLAPLSAEEAAVLGKQEGDRVPLKLKNTANEIVSRGLGTVAGANDTFVVNKGTGQTTPLGIGSPRAIFAPANRIIQVADPDHPGQTKFVTAGDAVKNGYAGPQSASVQIPKDVLKWATSGKGGEEINAFNTALQHGELLRKAVTALGNGDVRTLNSLKNEFKKEFGSSNISNFQVIANAYTREISKMLSSGHMTNDEINTNGATLPSNASPDQLIDAIDAYQQLAGSKMQMRYDQFQKGMQGKPNFPDNAANGGNQPPPNAATIPGPNTHVFSAKAWKAANPNGDVEAAKKAAKAANYRVVD